MPGVPDDAGPLSFATLKARHRAIRDDHPEPFRLRVHRALSWLKRAEAEVDDPDVRFILLWIGFNAAYAAEIEGSDPSARASFEAFFHRLCRLDRDGRCYDAVWTRFPQEIRVLLDNPFVFAPFWRHANGDAAAADWADRLASAKRRIQTALARRDTPAILSCIFDRLYVLRNQLVHGGATWEGGVNRAQVRDGAAILGHFLPLFLAIMMHHPSEDWGRPYYPVIR
jgi:hypothetical protein